MNKEEILYKLQLYKSMGYKFIDDEIVNTANKVNFIFTDLNRLNCEIKNCNLCELCKSRNKAVVGFSKRNNLHSQNIDIMIISVSPNLTQDRSGICTPDTVLHEAMSSLSQKNVYFTNLIKCKLKDPMNLKKNIQQCIGYIHSEISLIKPKLIVALGFEVFEALSGAICSFQSVRGGIFKIGQLVVIPTHSIDFIYKNPSAMETFNNDLQKIKGYI